MRKIYIAAAILAVITGILAYSFTASLEKAALREFIDVVTAAVPIQERTIITAEMLAVKSMPVEAVLPSAIRSIDEAVGLVSGSLIEQGEVLSSAKLHTQGDKTETLGYYVPEGMRAITLSVDIVSGVGGFVFPGDRIDLISTMTIANPDDPQAVPVLSAFLLLQDIEVLSSGPYTSISPGTRNLAYSTLTLAVTPEQALTLSMGIAAGRLQCVLRGGTDRDIVDIPPENLDTIIE